MARDLGSLNGVFYRGQRLERPIELALGEEVSFVGLNFLVESPDATTTHALPDAPKADDEVDAEVEVIDLKKFDLDSLSF